LTGSLVRCLTAVKLLQLGNQRPNVLFQMLKTLNQDGLGLAGFVQTAASNAIFDELVSIEMQSVDVKGPSLGQAVQKSILLPNQVCGNVVVERVKDAARRIGLPAVTLNSLQAWQQYTQFLGSSAPPTERGWKWSTVNSAPTSRSCTPQ
jgi:hypothetical protein